MTQKPNTQSQIPVITIDEHPLGLALMRDGEMMLTPKRNEVVLPNLALAEAVAEDYMSAATALQKAKQDKTPAASIGAGTMRKLANTAIDQVEDAREIIIEAMLAYLHTDTICYFSEDPELKQHERKYWQPIIDWMEEYFSCSILVFDGVMPGDQDELTTEAIGAHIQSYNNWQLAALMDLGSNLSSLMLALAVMEKRLTAEQAFECAMADEIYQNEKWGADEEAAARRDAQKKDLLETETFLSLI